MNILFTVHSYWPKNDGVQNVTQYLAEYLASNGHNVSVITLTSDAHRDRAVDTHNNVHIIWCLFRVVNSLHILGKSRYLEVVDEYAKKTDVIINVCIQSPCNDILLKRLKNYSCKKVLYLHGRPKYDLTKDNLLSKYGFQHLRKRIKSDLYYLFHTHLYSVYDDIIDINEHSEAFRFFKTRVNANFHIITNSVPQFDEKYFHPICNYKYFLCVANYSIHKNQLMLIKAFMNVKNKHGFKLILIGRSNNYSIQLKKYLNAHISEDIILLEDIDRETTKQYIANAYCGVLSSRREIVPVFLGETSICRHPFIATNVGCIPYIPGGITVKNAKEMTDAIQRLINDQEYCKRLSFEGYQYVIKNSHPAEKGRELEQILST